MALPIMFKKAFRASIPVALGYLPLGAAFGILFNSLEYHWIFAGLMGLVIFAGASQFMAIGLLSAQAELVEVFIATLILNSRHIFYGISLIQKYQHPFFARLYLIFGLTDETYSLVTSSNKEIGNSYFIYITALNHLYWTIGCITGAFISKKYSIFVPGLEYSLVALFLVLSIEQFKATRSIILLITAIIIALTSVLLTHEYMLFIAILLSSLILFSYGKSKKWNLKTTI